MHNLKRTFFPLNSDQPFTSFYILVIKQINTSLYESICFFEILKDKIFGHLHLLLFLDFLQNLIIIFLFFLLFGVHINQKHNTLGPILYNRFETPSQELNLTLLFFQHPTGIAQNIESRLLHLDFLYFLGFFFWLHRNLLRFAKQRPSLGSQSGRKLYFLSIFFLFLLTGVIIGRIPELRRLAIGLKL